MLNKNQFKAKWKEIRGGLRNIWGNLTDEELDQTDGNLTSIAQLVQTKYDESKDSIKEKLDLLMDSFDNDTDKGIIGKETSFERGPDGWGGHPENEQITRH
jgi:uncharacterized protein YjbJ (UPF0337 family)